MLEGLPIASPKMGVRRGCFEGKKEEVPSGDLFYVSAVNLYRRSPLMEVVMVPPSVFHPPGPA